MPWDDSLKTDPDNSGSYHSGSLSSVGAAGWVFWTTNDTAIFKFRDFSDALSITLELYNDEQTNTAPFDSVTFDMTGNSAPKFWRYQGFPTRGDGNAKDDFRCRITCEKKTNNSRSCANYDILRLN